MPSLWLRFDRDDEQIMGGDLPDMISLDVPSMAALLQANGHRPVADMIGFTAQEWADLMEATPPAFQEPWTHEKLPWISAQEGLDICATLRRALANTPEVFADYDGMAGNILQDVEDLEPVLQRALTAGANFNLVVDT